MKTSKSSKQSIIGVIEEHSKIVIEYLLLDDFSEAFDDSLEDFAKETLRTSKIVLTTFDDVPLTLVIYLVIYSVNRI